MIRFPIFSKVALVGLARDEAPEVLTSVSLEEALAPVIARLKLPPNLLAGMTGVLARRLYPKTVSPSDAAAAAAAKLLKALGFDHNLIRVLYSTSVCRDFIEPSTASVVQAKLGLGPQVKSLDIGSACLGFIDGLELAALQIEMGLIDYALVVDGENSRPITETTIARLLAPGATIKDFFKNFATLTLGSGGAAMILGPADKHPQAPRLRGSVSLSDAGSNHLCRGDHDGMETDAAALLTAGVNLAKATFEQGRAVFGWNPDNFDHLISHQVSEANTKKLCQELGLPEERLFKTYPDFGNMGPAAVPFTLDLARENNRLKKGDQVLLMGIGSGLASSMMELVW